MRSWLNTGETRMGIQVGRKWCRACWSEYLGRNTSAVSVFACCVRTGVGDILDIYTED
jgi:hypothetical protein